MIQEEIQLWKLKSKQTVEVNFELPFPVEHQQEFMKLMNSEIKMNIDILAKEFSRLSIMSIKSSSIKSLERNLKNKD